MQVADRQHVERVGQSDREAAAKKVCSSSERLYKNVEGVMHAKARWGIGKKRATSQISKLQILSTTLVPYIVHHNLSKGSIIMACISWTCLSWREFRRCLS
jgi:hypothetical protein